ncbi:Uncharacterised protein [Mycobacteroides abscessus subsp. abscessus]|nr:Uncharacterised protein [Mycobacteroides abscessus subsp. abscessus]
MERRVRRTEPSISRARTKEKRTEVSNEISDETLFQYLGELAKADSADRELAAISAAAETAARRELPGLLAHLTQVRDSKQ